MGGRSAVALAVALWLGLIAGAHAGQGTALACAVLASVFGWLGVRAPDRVGTLALLVAVALAGAARGAGHERVLARDRAAIADQDRPWRIEARVAEPPARESGEPEAVVAVARATPALAPGTRLRLRLPPGSDAEWGDRVRLVARVEVPQGVRNPGGFDARAAASSAALAASGRAWACAVHPSRGVAGWPRATVARWRRAIERVLDARLSGPARELVVPLVIGDRSALPPDLDAAFRASGLVHLLALSGLHVVWLAALARGLCATLGGGVGARALAGAACAAFYAGIAGPLPSLMRAAATEMVTALARGRGRALDPIQALALSALVLLVPAPGWAGDLGFQLSCAATLGLVTIGSWVTAAAGRGRAILAPFVPTAAAQIVALPVLLARFHALSWTGALANLVAVPVSGLLLAAAWLATAADLACPGLGGMLFGACEVLAGLLRTIATAAAALPAAMVSAGHHPAPAALAAAGATLLALALPEGRSLADRTRPVSRARFAARLLGGIAVAIAALLVAITAPLRPPPGVAWLVALDVGQGDALALGFADGWWLVDSGPRSPHYDAGERVVLPFLRWAGVRRLESLALTHDDGDHTGGAAAVARGVGIARRWAPPAYPGLPGPGPRFGAAAAARDDTLHRDPPVAVLWPPRPGPDSGAAGPAPSLTSADNAAGLVLEVGEGAGRALLLADVDSTVEESLAVEGGLAVLKVAHHGSASSSGTRLLARIGPALALLSVGRRNPFGHPAPSTLARLEAAGCRIARTDREGALWLELTRDASHRARSAFARVTARRRGSRDEGRARDRRLLVRALAALVDCGVAPSAPTLAVLASGQGTNFEALARAATRGELPGRIACLMCDRPDAEALGRARSLGIETLCPPAGRTRTRLEDERPWLDALRARGVELVLLAGFMRRLHAVLLDAFPMRILNIHPSLLPAFPGLDAIGQAWARGVRVTGCTVHLVTDALDAGPIVAQAAVEVRDDDTLEALTARVHEAEHRLYPAAVRRFLSEPWRQEGGRLVFGAGVRHA